MTHKLGAVKEKLERGEEVTLCVLGDSIVWGLNHGGAEETFVAVFARKLAEGYPMRMVVRYDGEVESEALPIRSFEGPIFVGGEKGGAPLVVVRNGVGGNTVRRALKRKRDFLSAMPNGAVADVTFTFFGINDALRSDAAKYVPVSVFEADYEELVREITATPCLLIPITPTYNGEKYPLGEYAEAVRRVAARHGLPFVDAHKLWAAHYRAGAPRFGQGDWLSDSKTDACHFSPAGAKAMGEFLFDAFQSILKG